MNNPLTDPNNPMSYMGFGSPEKAQAANDAIAGFVSKGMGVIVTALILIVGFVMFRRIFR